MKNIFKLGGIFAGIVLIAIGIGSIVIGTSGHGEVGTDLKREKITGTPDMTPKAIAGEAKAAGLTNVDLPTCSVAGKEIKTGSDAKCFASYMRIHALEATGGRTYAQMGRYLTASGKETDDQKAAAKDPKTGQPVENGARNIWVNETALSTALNTSYFAQQVALFSIVMGIALVLVGIGLLVLSLGVLPARGAGSAADTRAAAGTGAPSAA
jgi:hypothetical protein